MKNIIIMGEGRAGKTTLSKMLKETCPQYNVIHADAIKWGIIRAQGKEPEFRKNIAKQMEWEKSAFFQDVLIEIFAHNIKNNHTPLILETGQLYLENLIKHPKYNVIKESTDILVLGIGTKTSQQRVQACKNMIQKPTGLTAFQMKYYLTTLLIEKFRTYNVLKNVSIMESCITIHLVTG